MCKILTLGLPAFRYIMGALNSFESVICISLLCCAPCEQSVPCSLGAGENSDRSISCVSSMHPPPWV